MAMAAVSTEKTGTRLERSIWYMGGLMTVHADAKDTNGAFSMVEMDGAPGCEPPLHVHEREDEMFYILEGRVQFTRGSEQFVLGPGESGFLPRGVPHTFKILSGRAKALGYITPAGFEEFFRSVGRPAEALTPDPNPTAPDPGRIVSLSGTFGVRVLR